MLAFQRDNLAKYSYVTKAMSQCTNINRLIEIERGMFYNWYQVGVANS